MRAAQRDPKRARTRESRPGPSGQPTLVRGSRRQLVLVGSLVGLLVVLAACRSVDVPLPAVTRDAVDCPRLTVASITAPVEGQGSRELDHLRLRCAGPAGRLREAFVLAETGDANTALKILNRLVYGNQEHGAAVEAFARYLRSEIFEHRGEKERAAHERDAAGNLAIDATLRERLAARFEAPKRPTPAAAHVAILPRSAWNARRARPRSMTPMRRVQRITVHHSANLTRGNGRQTSISAIHAIQRYHLESNGWGDIGYHFLIDPAGRIWSGRALQWQGAHAGDDTKNRHNVGICLLGNFVPSAQGPPRQAQLDALYTLVTALCARYRIRPDDILTHRELRPTSCPGPYLQAATQKIRDGLRALAAPAD